MITPGNTCFRKQQVSVMALSGYLYGGESKGPLPLVVGSTTHFGGER